MADLLQEIEAQIMGAKATAGKQNVGIIREIGDGVARIEGLADAMLNEMIDLGHGITGLALNLDETEVGVIILGDYTQLQEGDEVRATGKLLQVPVGKGLLGRVVNMLGEPVDGKGPVKSDVAYPVEKMAPGIIRRRPVSQPVQTGIMAIDAMVPIGRGQRQLIIGDRSTGKTTSVSTPSSVRRVSIKRLRLPATKLSARSTAFTWRLARSSPVLPEPLPSSRKPGQCPTPSSLLLPLPIRRRINIWLHSPERRLASGSWTMAWTR